MTGGPESPARAREAPSGDPDSCGFVAPGLPDEAWTTHGPLVAMLARIQSSFEAEFDRRLRETEFCALSLAHSRNVLRHLAAGPQRASRLVEVSGVTKQAISQQLAQLARDGYVTIGGDPADQRARLVVLTERGNRAQTLIRELFVEIERDWTGLLAQPEDFPQLRSLSASLVEKLCPSTCQPPVAGPVP